MVYPTPHTPPPTPEPPQPSPPRPSSSPLPPTPLGQPSPATVQQTLLGMTSALFNEERQVGVKDWTAGVHPKSVNRAIPLPVCMSCCVWLRWPDDGSLISHHVQWTWPAHSLAHSMSTLPCAGVVQAATGACSIQAERQDEPSRCHQGPSGPPCPFP